MAPARRDIAQEEVGEVLFVVRGDADVDHLGTARLGELLGREHANVGFHALEQRGGELAPVGTGHVVVGADHLDAHVIGTRIAHLLYASGD